MENIIYNPEDIIKGKKYVSNMSQLNDTIYMGVSEYPTNTNHRMMILNHGEDFENYIGYLIPNKITNPIWKNGFRLIN